MKGINKAEHRKLISTLLFLELLIKDRNLMDDLQMTTNFCRELETALNNYEESLRELELQINSYKELYKLVRINFLSRKLKELEKAISYEEISQLRKVFRGAYNNQ